MQRTVSRTAVEIGLSDQMPEVEALARAILAPRDQPLIDELRSRLDSNNFETVWQVLRLLRIVAIPDLAHDVCAQLDRSVEGKPLAYDVLYALSDPNMARKAAPQLSEQPGIEGVVARVVAEARGANRNAARSFASLLAAFDDQAMERALAAAEKEVESRDVAQILRSEVRNSSPRRRR